mmetsp:Transcript_15015/g.24838  ORF Transcript_15015/g.24838 Transcript_15015/m.24838 type:complete len:165 (+) Transcript_15015:141-635(+)
MIARTSILSLLLLSFLGAASSFIIGAARTYGVRTTSLFERKDADMTEEERAAAIEKSTKAMTAFTNKYLENTATKLCSDLSVPAVVIKGLAEHKVTLGAPLCPCRFYDDKEKEAKDGYWNCPCVPMRERHECHCMLFLTEDNAFAGDEENITFDEVVDLSSGMA